MVALTVHVVHSAQLVLYMHLLVHIGYIVMCVLVYLVQLVQGRKLMVHFVHLAEPIQCMSLLVHILIVYLVQCIGLQVHFGRPRHWSVSLEQ